MGITIGNKNAIMISYPNYISIVFETIQARLVSERKLKRHQRVTYLRYQARLFKLWNEYVAEEQKRQQT